MRYLSLLIVALLTISCQEEFSDKLFMMQGNAFGTTYSIQFYTQKEKDLQKGLDSVLAAVNQSVSTYIPESDISKINKGDSTIQVDVIFRDVFIISERVYDQSNQYFDPTIGVLRNAYGFGTDTPLQNIEGTILDSLRQFVGFNKVNLLPDGTIQKMYPEIYFDFNAVAKGYGIDCIGKFLETKGIQHYLIELGGEVLSRGKNLDKDQFWTVGVEKVNSDLMDRSYSEILFLKNQGLAASGNYRKYRIDSVSGKKYVHTINPLTGEAEASNVTSATVIAATCGYADAYATACMAMGLEQSQRMLKTLDGVEAYLTYLDEDGTSKVYMTDGFKQLLVNK